MRFSRLVVVGAALMVAILAAACAASDGAEEGSGDGLHSTVPNVVGMTAFDASQALEEAGYDSPALTGVPSEEPSGTVIEQDPVAGTSLARGGIVELTYSTGPSANP